MQNQLLLHLLVQTTISLQVWHWTELSKYLTQQKSFKSRQSKYLPDLVLMLSRFVHVNLPLDHATAMCFSADGHHIILALGDSKDIIAYRIREKVGNSFSSLNHFNRKTNKAKSTKKFIAFQLENNTLTTSIPSLLLATISLF